MNTLKILKAARELIREEKRWSNKSHARNISGEAVKFSDNDAVCWDALGAIKKQYLRYFEASLRGAITAFEDEVPLYYSANYGIAEFNATHTHAEVLDIFDKAIEKMPTVSKTLREAARNIDSENIRYISHAVFWSSSYYEEQDAMAALRRLYPETALYYESTESWEERVMLLLFAAEILESGGI